MTQLRAFYSWQSDTPAEANRDFIRDCLVQASVRSSLRVCVDESTRGIPGTPDIVESTRAKIARCSLFVPDLTLVGEYKAGRYTVNPNVLFEYGIALEAVGAEKILPVFNSYFGGVGDLPFDISRRAVRASYDYDGNGGNKGSVQRSFVNTLVREINLIIEEGLFSGLDQLAVDLIEYFVRTSEVGTHQTLPLDLALYSRENSVSQMDLWSAAEQLIGRELADEIGGGGRPFESLRPKNRLFWEFDHIVKGWSPERDACRVAKILTNRRGKFHNQVTLDILCAETGWSFRRLYPSVTWLADHKKVQTGIDAGFPRESSSICETLETRKFVRENNRRSS